MNQKSAAGKRDAALFTVEPVCLKFIRQEKIPNGDADTVELREGETRGFRHRGQDGFYFVTGGLLKLEVQSPDTRILRLCFPGDLAGFGLWLTGDANKYSLQALRPSTLQFCSQRFYGQLKQKHPELNDLVVEHLCKTIFHKDERIASLEGTSTIGRVARLLSWLAKAFGRAVEDGVLIDLYLDRESMAQLAGTIPVTLSRMLSQLSDEKIIRRHRRLIVIQNMAGLAKHF